MKLIIKDRDKHVPIPFNLAIGILYPSEIFKKHGEREIFYLVHPKNMSMGILSPSGIFSNLSQ